MSLADISTASSCWVVVPKTGNVTKISAIIDTAISGADAVITAQISSANTSIPETITITKLASAPGQMFHCAPSILNSLVTAGENIKLTTNGASTNVSTAVFTIEITV